MDIVCTYTRLFCLYLNGDNFENSRYKFAAVSCFNHFHSVLFLTISDFWKDLIILCVLSLKQN